jgi:hypothetical protein
MTNRVIVPARQATKAGGIDTVELIPGLLKRLQIRALEDVGGGGGVRLICVQMMNDDIYFYSSPHLLPP